ncbi:MAG: hypothetical protein N2C14_25820, partial [Planctomycetales bacterium]
LAGCVACLVGPIETRAEEPVALAADAKPKRVAAVVSAYYHNSHADVIVSQLLQTETLDGKGRRPALKLVSLHTDQVPQNDVSRKLAREHGVPIFSTVKEALTLGGDKLAVDAVLLVAEHGKYPRSETGQIQYPKRRLFEQVVKVFEDSGRSAPVFVDKHLADNWKDAKWIYDASKRLNFPLMAGSSLPVLYRYPPVDLKKGAKLKEVVAVSYHTLDAYGFHALEMLQSIVERRRGGETGVKQVRCLVDAEVWKAEEEGVYSRKLLDKALSRLKRPLRKNQTLRESVKHPVLFVIDYQDGLRANVLTLNQAVAEWAIAWETESRETQSTLFWTQEARPFTHFTHLLRGVERMFHRGKPSWPPERTLMTSGLLDALLISKRQGGRMLRTPYLEFSYDSDWTWVRPPDPPPGRPISGQ